MADYVYSKLKLQGHGANSHRLTARILDQHPSMVALASLVSDEARFGQVAQQVVATFEQQKVTHNQVVQLNHHVGSYPVAGKNTAAVNSLPKDVFMSSTVK